MSSERDELFPIDPHVRSESMQAIPPSSFPSGMFVSSPPTTVTGSLGMNSTSSIFGSTSSPSLSESLGSDQAQFVLFRVQDLERKTDAIMAEMGQQRALLERIFRKRGWDADDEDNENTVQKKKKKKLSETRPLTSMPLNDLTEEQSKTRKELLAHIDKQMRTLAGLENDERVLPKDATPGEEGGHIIPDFKKEVVDSINKRLISQAAFLVYTQQTDFTTRKLTYPGVPFTSNDVDELTKEAFRSWKRKHENTQDPERKKKHKETSKKAMRRQRKRQGAELYNTQMGIDASPLLLTDWMSDYLSDRSDIATENDKDEYKLMKCKAAGYSPETKDVEVWETIRPAFRSAEVNQVYEKLDELFVERQRLSKKKKPTVRRVHLGKMKYDIPATAPYPFMVDSAWKAVFVDERGLADDFKVMPEDPKYFGMRRNERPPHASGAREMN
ncbi:hypothetical protein ACEPAI_6681 [Sanghuangporus weigelae]